LVGYKRESKKKRDTKGRGIRRDKQQYAMTKSISNERTIEEREAQQNIFQSFSLVVYGSKTISLPFVFIISFRLLLFACFFFSLFLLMDG